MQRIVSADLAYRHYRDVGIAVLEANDLAIKKAPAHDGPRRRAVASHRKRAGHRRSARGGPGMTTLQDRAALARSPGAWPRHARITALADTVRADEQAQIEMCYRTEDC
jgi:hypothetical protein